jgi:molecular chaperone GrpE
MMKAASSAGRQVVQDEARGTAAPAQDNESFLDRAVTAEHQRDEYLQLLQRTAAEFENFRKRIQREQTEDQRYAHGVFVRELLPVVDNLQRALKSARQTEERSPLIQGLTAVESQLFDVFRRFGVVPIDPRGQRFDPNRHEAVVYEPSAEVAPGNVSSVLEPGYQLHQRILRPARVAVAAPPSE